MSDFITNHRGEEVEPKSPRIIGLQIDDDGRHFHKIQYKRDLKITLQQTIIFGEPGLMTRANYFEDEEYTIPVLWVEREYQINPITGRLERKNTKRYYYCEDGTVHSHVKAPGWKTYTPEKSRDATHRRRKNITNQLEDQMIGLLAQMAGPDPANQIASIQAGAAFMNELSPGISAFHLSGNIQTIVDFVNYPQTQQDYPFLLAEVSPGVQAKDFIIAGITY